MLTNYNDILTRDSIFLNRSVLSPYYIPKILPYREKQIDAIIRATHPCLKGQSAMNMFIYGNTGTGKTCSVKYVMEKFNETARKMGANTEMVYVNCRVYNSRYRIFQKVLKAHYPELDKSGFGMSYIYEKLIELMERPHHLVVILDEMDMVKDIDDLIYTLIRSNDETKRGSLSVVGISNRLTFKSKLDPRSRSSLNENEIIFPPYDAKQLFEILKNRVKEGFKPSTVDDVALSLIAAITSQENGDARYALKLLLKAGEIAEESEDKKVTEKHVEEARKQVDYNIVAMAINTLPANQQILLYTIAKMSLSNRMKKMGEDNYLFSGDVYKNYVKISKALGRKPKSARWYREYINDIESLGLISTVFTSKGIRGHSRLISIGHNPEDVIKIVEKNLGVSE